MSDQPEALLLADALENNAMSSFRRYKAAALLRHQHAEIASLKAERDALRADAERYRWLKQYKIAHNGYAHHWIPGEPLWDQNLDAAIDNAALDDAAIDAAREAGE